MSKEDVTLPSMKGLVEMLAVFKRYVEACFPLTQDCKRKLHLAQYIYVKYTDQCNFDVFRFSDDKIYCTISF